MTSKSSHLREQIWVRAKSGCQSHEVRQTQAFSLGTWKMGNKSLDIESTHVCVELLHSLSFSCPLVGALLLYGLRQPLIFDLWLRSGVGSRCGGARLCPCNSRIDLLLTDLLSSTHSSGNLRGDRDPLNTGLCDKKKTTSVIQDCHYDYERPKAGAES